VLRNEQVAIKTIAAGKIRRYIDPLAVLQNVIDVAVKIPVGFLQSFFYLFLGNPDLLFSKGGYGSYPVALAARALGVPLFLQESDIAPGMVSRKVASYAVEIFASFPKTEELPQKKTIVAGNPIRQDAFNGRLEAANKLFNLSGRRKVILVLGGSQGAQRVNDKVLDILPELLKEYEIIHQTGQKNIDAVLKEAKAIMTKDQELYYRAYGFLTDKTIAPAYAAADLVVSRAGSGSIFEIAANKLPSILIPLPEAAQNHQVKNAYAYARAGAAIVMEENNFTSNFLMAKIKDILNDPQKMAAMSDAAGQFARPRAAHVIAEYLLNYLTR